MLERFTLQSARAALSAAVEAAESSTGEKPFLVGFSLGGYVAIDWIAHNPDRVSGLLAAACGTDPGPVVVTVWRQLARAIHLLPDRGMALNNAAVRLFVPQPGAADVIAGGVALEVMDDVLTVLGSLRPSRSLALVDVPVTFVNGALDHVRLHDRRMLKATRLGKLVTVPGATHMVSVIKPELFTRLMASAYSMAGGTPTPDRLP